MDIQHTVQDRFVGDIHEQEQMDVADKASTARSVDISPGSSPRGYTKPHLLLLLFKRLMTNWNLYSRILSNQSFMRQNKWTSQIMRSTYLPPNQLNHTSKRTTRPLTWNSPQSPLNQNTKRVWSNLHQNPQLDTQPNRLNMS